ncbi:MAG: hypothetical protein PQJ58_18225, partial [Spirochaetales bacterium]|nr:hypothetical protein [Spirochaetales bacterium]
IDFEFQNLTVKIRKNDLGRQTQSLAGESLSKVFEAKSIIDLYCTDEMYSESFYLMQKFQDIFFAVKNNTFDIENLDKDFAVLNLDIWSYKVCDKISAYISMNKENRKRLSFQKSESDKLYHKYGSLKSLD